MQDLLPNKNARRKSARGKIRPKKKNPRGNSRQASARALERHSFSVYDGIVARGFIEQRGPHFTAKTLGGKRIGLFQNLKSAVGAFGASAEAA